MIERLSKAISMALVGYEFLRNPWTFHFTWIRPHWPKFINHLNLLTLELSQYFQSGSFSPKASSSLPTATAADSEMPCQAVFALVHLTRDGVQPPVFGTPALKRKFKKLVTWSRVGPLLPPIYNPARQKICALPIPLNVGHAPDSDMDSGFLPMQTIFFLVLWHGTGPHHDTDDCSLQQLARHRKILTARWLNENLFPISFLP